MKNYYCYCCCWKCMISIIESGKTFIFHLTEEESFSDWMVFDFHFHISRTPPQMKIIYFPCNYSCISSVIFTICYFYLFILCTHWWCSSGKVLIAAATEVVPEVKQNKLLWLSLNGNVYESLEWLIDWMMNGWMSDGRKILQIQW